MRTIERVCVDRCGYEVAVGGDVASAVDRMTPQACPRCGGDLTPAGRDAA